MKTIVTITNKDYLVGTLVMFYSLLKNGNVDEFAFYILHDETLDLSYASTELMKIQQAFGKEVGFAFKGISFDDFGDNTIDFYKNALAKLSIFELEDDFLFLDSDLLILDDISDIFEVDSDFAACVDTGTPNEFNTGVMLIRKKWLTKENYNWLVDSAKRRFSHRGDQEHINDLIRNDFQILPSEYNVLKDSHRFRGSWLSRVKILHYISKKPWMPFHPILHKPGNLECLDIDRLWLKYFDEIKLDYYLIKSREDFTKKLNELCPKGYGVEVGVQEGKFSKTLLENWNCKTLFLVDPWVQHGKYKNDVGAVPNEEHEKCYQETIKNIEGYEERVEIIKDFSVEASEEFYDESLDFVYLDARHDKDGIAEDIEAWWPKVKKGGILAGHDYTDLKWGKNHIEVKSVVDNRFDKVHCTLDGPYPSWWVKKT